MCRWVLQPIEQGTSGGGAGSTRGVMGDGTSGILGPCLRVRPGSTLMVKLINNMAGASAALNSRRPLPSDWSEMVRHRG